MANWESAQKYPWYDGAQYEQKYAEWKWLVSIYGIVKVCDRRLRATNAIKSILRSRLYTRHCKSDVHDYVLDHMRMAKTKNGKYILIYAPYDGGEPEEAQAYFRSIGLNVDAYRPGAYLPSCDFNSTIVVYSNT